VLLLCICYAYCIFNDCTYGVVCLLYIWYCVHIAYAMQGIDGAMYMLDMQCCVHDGYAVFCAYGVMWMLICDGVYIWCYVHVV